MNTFFACLSRGTVSLATSGLLLFTVIAAFASITPQAQAVGEASTRFQIYVPPNNISGRDVALIVTAQLDNTTVDILDDGADGDTDDTYTDVSLDRGDSYVVYMRDGNINDDARGKWDGDYFIITSDLPVTVQMSTNSDWQHDWAPADNKKMIGQNFYLFSPPTSFSDRDINVFAYSDDTEVVLYDITTTPITTTGKATVDIDNAKKVLNATLSEGEDLIVRNNLGVDLLDPGRSYLVTATQPITVQYGALYDKRRNSARDGGGFVPARNGSSAGEDFYFFVPHNPNRKSEIEIRVISFDDSNNVVLEGWDEDTESWIVVRNWLLDSLDHEDYVGGNYNLFRANTSLGKKISIFEANWLETGSSGTSDVASFLSSESGSGAGKDFLAYVGPPGLQTNVSTQQGKFSHLFLFAEEANTTVTVVDADTDGTIFNETYVVDAGGYADVKVTQAQWNQLNNSGAGVRPYLKVTSDKIISVLSTNWNDNWMTFATSVLLPNPQSTLAVSAPEANLGDAVTFTLTTENIGENSLNNPEVTVTIPDGLTYISTGGDLGGAPSVSTINGVTTLTFDGFSFPSGTIINQAINTTLDSTYNNSDEVLNGDVLTVQTVTRGTTNGQDYITADSASTKAINPSQTDIASFSAIKRLDRAVLGWETSFENNIAGYNLYRSTKADGRYRKVNGSLITSQGNSPTGNVYTYSNSRLNYNQDYFFKLEVVPNVGDKWYYGPVSSADLDDASLALIFPNGGRTLVDGERVFITWGSLGLDGTSVRIEYSKDDFASDINTIIASTPNNGQYRWTVPSDHTNNLKIRITSNIDNDVVDISEEASIIQPPEYSNPPMEVFAQHLDPIAVGATKHFPFGIADYTDSACIYNLTASVDISGWTNTIYHDANGNGILDPEENTVVSQTPPLDESIDSYDVIIKADLNPTLDEENPTVDSWDYELDLTATCSTDPTKRDTGFYHKYEAEYMGSDGHIVSDPDASNQTAVKGSVPNVLHHLTYGGYFTKYTANNKFQAVVYRAKVSDNDFVVPAGELDIVDFTLGGGNNDTVNEFVFPANQFFNINTYQGIYLYMISPLSGVLEPRVDYYGITDMWVDTVEIRSLRKGANLTYEAEFMEKFTGIVENDSDSSGGQHITSVLGETGHMSFGPYTTLPNNPDVQYEAVFRLKVDDNSIPEQIGKIEINNYLGDGIVAQADIFASQFLESDEWQEFTLSWTGRPLDTANSGFIGSSMEYRVWSYGNTNTTFSVDKITQRRTANQQPVYEAELNPRTTGVIVADRDASNMAAVESDERGFIMFGPGTTDQIGNTDVVYQAIFRMKVDDNSITKPGAYIDVYNADGIVDERLGGFTIYPSQFQNDDKYQNFIIQFTGPAQGELQFRTETYGVTKFTLDKVEVRPVTSAENINQSEFNELRKFEDADFFSSNGVYSYDGIAADQQSLSGTQAGFMAFGPYTTETVGATTTHRARFTLKTTSNTRSAPIVKVEVHAVESDVILGEKVVFGNQFIAAKQYQNFFVDYTPPTDGTIEFRTYLYGTGETISLDSVKLFNVDAIETVEEVRDVNGNLRRYSYPASNLNHFDSAIFYDIRSQTGRVLKSSAGDPHFTAYGPYTLDGVGTGAAYQAKFGMAVDDNTLDEPVARVEAYNLGAILSSVEIFGTQFNAVDEYQEFPINFASPIDGRLEYRVYTYGNADLSLDYVDVYELTADTSAPEAYDYRFEAETDLPSRQGSPSFQSKASRQQAMRGKTAGHLGFGPYTTNLSGTDTTYIATTYLRSTDVTGGGVVALLDVTIDGDERYKRLVFANEFTNDDDYFGFPITFDAPDAGAEVQFRTYIYGDRTMYLDRVDVVDTANASTTAAGIQYKYHAASDFAFSAATTVTDPAAESGQALITNGSGIAMFGPGTTDGVGSDEDYEARFYIKTPNNTDTNQAVTIDVYNDGVVLASKIIFPVEFSAAEAYQYFPVPFSAPSNGTLEYRVTSHDNTSITIDRVEVHKVVSTDTSIGNGDYNYEAEHLPRAVGASIQDADAGNAQGARSVIGEIGHVVFGPYTTETIGTGNTYKAKFRLKVSDSSESDDVVTLDVANGFTTLSKLVLSGSDFDDDDEYEWFSVTFDAPAGGDLQFRVYSEGLVDITVDRIEVDMIDAGESIDSGDQLFRYQAADLSRFLGQMVFDTDATANQAILAPAGSQGVVSFGPYTSDGVGTGADYEARFRMKIDANTSTAPAVRIDVYNNGGVIDELVIFPTQFTAADTYEDFIVPFTSPAGGTIEYRVHNYNSVEQVWVDRIDIYPSTGISDSSGVDYRYEGENLYPLIGSPVFENGASENRSLRAQNGETGRLAFGPYTSDGVGSGKEFKAKFYLKVSDNTSSNRAVNIDVMNEFTKLAELTLDADDFAASDTYEAFTLLFDAPTSGTLQYRAYTYGNTAVYLDKVEIIEVTGEDAASGDQLWRYNAATDLNIFLGDVVFDADAVGLQSVRTQSGVTGTVTFGPYTSDGVGTGADYDAHFVAKIDDNTSGSNNPVAKVDIYANGLILGEQFLYADDFTSNDTYQTFVVPFTSPGSGQLEYRMFSYGETDEITMDRIDIFAGTGGGQTAMFTYEVENLFQIIGQKQFSAGQSNSRVVRAAAGQAGHLAFGPYTADAVGTGDTYSANFSIKIPAGVATGTKLITLDVANGNNQLGVLELNAENFSNPGTFDTFTIPFTSPSSGTLQYRIYTHGVTDVEADVVTITGQ